MISDFMPRGGPNHHAEQFAESNVRYFRGRIPHMQRIHVHGFMCEEHSNPLQELLGKPNEKNMSVPLHHLHPLHQLHLHQTINLHYRYFFLLHLGNMHDLHRLHHIRHLPQFQSISPNITHVIWIIYLLFIYITYIIHQIYFNHFNLQCSTSTRTIFHKTPQM